jgi:hypothetical protein
LGGFGYKLIPLPVNHHTIKGQTPDSIQRIIYSTIVRKLTELFQLLRDTFKLG